MNRKKPPQKGVGYGNQRERTRGRTDRRDESRRVCRGISTGRIEEKKRCKKTQIRGGDPTAKEKGFEKDDLPGVSSLPNEGNEREFSMKIHRS